MLDPNRRLRDEATTWMTIGAGWLVGFYSPLAAVAAVHVGDLWGRGANPGAGIAFLAVVALPLLFPAVLALPPAAFGGFGFEWLHARFDWKWSLRASVFTGAYLGGFLGAVGLVVLLMIVRSL
ncbi:hypothetical protein [Alienimonas sp. DA493]|uniref:hypothetical protein n=1 Tax=Alienimonas sp. DA493 TaxID=3373605 RepID=UPI00375407E1